MTDKGITFFWRKIENLGRVHKPSILMTPSRRIKILQPRNRHGATLTKLDGFYLFGGKSHEIHNEMIRLDLHCTQWTNVNPK